ncbi:type IV pilin protein [Rubrivivax gelatinosus]|uniref:type IV pilin protein n=1 Tax=Rubrivivax gelatinosus TaxID=28068 RepID=UPI0002DC8251|nr:prepilin-type N-terminal cleavage/methylation domain-containing protein [Rubrivivax gelatinosus]MBG6079693.1 type IV pilus assembly protein PilE [Rubrivivax gelatinosus]
MTLRSRPAARAGFTLIELMIALAILAILAAVALPSYNSYVRRSKIPVGLDALSAFATRMEQRYQDVGKYEGETGKCAFQPTNNLPDFTLSCELTNSGQGFTATAAGKNSVSDFTFTINASGARTTTYKSTTLTCWSTKGTVCDT